MRASHRLLSLACFFLCQGAASGCRGTADTAPRGDGALGAEAALQAPAAPSLPPLRLEDNTPNLLLTWVAEDGDFHVVESVAAVPQERRQQVRVVVADQASGGGQTVYVADLTAKREDGTYVVTAMARADWEKIGADRRKTRMEALAPGQPSAPDGTGSPGGNLPAGAVESATGGAPAPRAITAIVYGADWCKPCHDAERYLQSLGVSVTKKDIEESRAAQAEMQQKLLRVNRAGAGIPVIDVMGKIFVGYSPGPLKQAVDAARQKPG